MKHKIIIASIFLFYNSAIFSQSNKVVITYELSNGGQLTFTQAEYDSLTNLSKNQVDSFDYKKQREILYSIYYTKRDRIFKNLMNLPLNDFESRDSEGYVQNSQNYRGRVLIIHFWVFESSDLNFKYTIPALNRLVDTYAKDGLAVLSMTNTPLGGHEKEVLKENTLKFPLIANAGNLMNSYFKMQLMRPCIMIIDKIGTIRYIFDSNQIFKRKDTYEDKTIFSFEDEIKNMLQG